MVPTRPTIVLDLNQFNDFTSRKECAVHLLALLDLDNTTSVDLVNVVSGDPILVGKIMRLANSAYYGMSSMVSDLRFAISVLGYSTLRSLAVTSIANSIYPIPLQHWRRSLFLAGSASSIATQLECEPTQAICAGLLADIGELVLMRTDGFNYTDMRHAAESFSGSERISAILAMERERYGMDHAAISAELMRGWNFPTEIVTSVEHHHQRAGTSGLEATLSMAQLYADHIETPKKQGQVAMPPELAILDLNRVGSDVATFLSIMLGI
ncbi:MAG: HDOD domain-containing protein [Acidimicrobiaceae bacterium]|nr:HDOD domain-containing protein [Acidimicrobiaceae bacterium]